MLDRSCTERPPGRFFNDHWCVVCGAPATKDVSDDNPTS